MKKYYFILQLDDNKIGGHANTIAGVKRVFNKTNATQCSVYKKLSVTYADLPFVVYLK